MPLFERLTYRWWQGLSRNGLPMMEATAKCERNYKAQGGNNELLVLHGKKSPFLTPARQAENPNDLTMTT